MKEKADSIGQAGQADDQEKNNDHFYTLNQWFKLIRIKMIRINKEMEGGITTKFNRASIPGQYTDMLFIGRILYSYQSEFLVRIRIPSISCKTSPKLGASDSITFSEPRCL